MSDHALVFLLALALAGCCENPSPKYEFSDEVNEGCYYDGCNECCTVDGRSFTCTLVACIPALPPMEEE